MESFVIAIAVATFAGFLGYKVGYSKGVKVNAPAPTAPLRTPYDPRKDLR